jgi:hypothetical protein
MRRKHPERQHATVHASDCLAFYGSEKNINTQPRKTLQISGSIVFYRNHRELGPHVNLYSPIDRSHQVSPLLVSLAWMHYGPFSRTHCGVLGDSQPKPPDLLPDFSSKYSMRRCSYVYDDARQCRFPSIRMRYHSCFGQARHYPWR